MNYEKYYEKRGDGSYLIHFPNRGLSEEEIKNIFSAYGKVSSTDFRGDSYGLCFVRYKSLKDTIACLDGLKNHKSIKILPHRNRVKPQVNNKDHKFVQQIHSTNNRKNYKDYHNNAQRESKTYNSAPSESRTYNSAPRKAKRHNSSCASSNTSISPLKELVKSKQLESATSTSSEVENSFNENEIPVLVCNDQKLSNEYRKWSQITSCVIAAQEVIVANVHPKLAPLEILNFFNEYKPIAASNIFQVPSIGIKYCHLYFKSTEQATAVEKKFDKYLWCGKHLIVLRLHALAEQALVI